MLFQQGDFQQGPDGQASPASIKRRRDVAAALQSGRAPRNIGEGLNAVGNAFKSRRLNKRADADEQAGNAAAAEAFQGAIDGGDLNGLLQASSNPFLSDGQQRVLGVLQNQKLQEQDPLRQLQIQRAEQGISLDRQRFGLQQQQFNFRRQQAAQAAARARANAARVNPRDFIKDANGRLRNINTGQLAFPDVEVEQQAAGGFTTPIQGIGADGNPAFFQANDRGEIKQIEGFSPNNSLQKVDTGTGTQLVDRAGNVVNSFETDDFSPARDKALGAALGRDTGAAQEQLTSVTSKLPQLEQVTDRLKDLAQTATFTAAGRATDEIRRQLGQDPSQGGLDRTEFEATVNNQVLPLLRDTFGAAFTEKEGQALRASLGDANKSPKEKEATLDAFIQQKKRDVQSLQNRTGGASQPKRLRFNPQTGEFE